MRGLSSRAHSRNRHVRSFAGSIGRTETRRLRLGTRVASPIRNATSGTRKHGRCKMKTQSIYCYESRSFIFHDYLRFHRDTSDTPASNTTSQPWPGRDCQSPSLRDQVLFDGDVLPSLLAIARLLDSSKWRLSGGGVAFIANVSNVTQCDAYWIRTNLCSCQSFQPRDSQASSRCG